MSGCPVGCKFCGTGNKFIRNLNSDEIVEQIITILSDKEILSSIQDAERFQIMFMSMGEPMLNWENVESAIRKLHLEFPKAELLLSTIGPNKPESFNKLLKLSCEIEKIGLQFSIHKAWDYQRDILIPYKDKMPLAQIRDYGTLWWKETGRKPYLNYCLDGTNGSSPNADKLMDLFSPLIFCFTFSVVCSKDENMKNAGYKNLAQIRQFEQEFLRKGYNTRIFNPDGQDDIGGGCGQLWYVQQWMKEHGR
jgi:Predicted Fe-S-cluster redox enzyme